MKWRIVIEAWPHSTGDGREADQKAAGERESYFYVQANDISGALTMARCFQQGIQHNPAVWEAPITAIHKVPEP